MYAIRSYYDVNLADGRSVQELLLSSGLAVRVAIPPNLDRQQAYAAASYNFV